MRTGVTLSRMKKKFLIHLTVLAILAVAFSIHREPARTLTQKELLGKKIFFDEALSDPEGMSCATCHDKRGGWAGPDSKINKDTAKRIMLPYLRKCSARILYLWKKLIRCINGRRLR